MCKKVFIILSCVIVASVLVAATNDQLAVEGVKLFISKAQGESAYIDALRWYQYTGTTIEKNPGSYVLSEYGKEGLTESKIPENAKGKYLQAFGDRSGDRIKNLWNANKNDLLKLMPKGVYDNNFKEEVNNTISLREKPEYNNYMKTLKEKSPNLDENTLYTAADIVQWENYKALAFWYRRTVEKNDAAVLQILKDIKANYEK